ncbi:MAG: sigma-54 dependent transcriptional regulator [Bacteroidales bacterium]|nr:sigma-54 dependent transcriptional regulator [Bacteroidales bacterium]
MDSQELQKLKNKYDIVGSDAALDRALETAVAVAPTDLIVLVSGESGVGKENIPKIIHQNSRRKTGKYFAVNCGAIPEGTIDSELFGHEKGSFTGATETRKGYFEEADGGTLFLDEIGELPLPSQAKLLRVLQNGEFIKVGSSKVQKTDVRVIAATNVNLSHAVAQGKFRADLYYRLNAIQIRMPALRERKGDIYLLFRKFTSDFSARNGICKVALTNDAVQMLINYRWPGNIRQLKNVAETITALESKPLTPTTERVVLDAPTLSLYMPREEEALPAVFDGPQQGGSGMSDADRQMIIKALIELKQDVEKLKQERQNSPMATGQTPLQPPIQAPIPTSNINTAPIQSHIQPEPQNPEPEEVEWQDAAPLTLSVQKMNEDLIRKALERSGGNRKVAADELGISERTLYRWIKRYSLDK